MTKCFHVGLLIRRGADQATCLRNLQSHGLCLLSCASAQHTGWGNLFNGLATTCSNFLWAHQLFQAVHGGADDVQSVIRTQRLGQDVLDAGALQNWTRGTTGDDTGTRSGRTQQDDASSPCTG